MNVLKNPQFVLDLEKDALLTANLDVFAQLLMDACSEPNEQRSSLFGADIQRYRQKIERYFDRIRTQAPLDEQKLLQEMHNLSEVSFLFYFGLWFRLIDCFFCGRLQKYLSEVDNRNSLSELLVYANRYKQVIAQSIQHDPDLFNQFQSIFELCSN
jgi:hypothetical protein